MTAPRSPRSTWSREELLLALNLYGRLPFGRMHHGNPDVIALANLLGRTPSSIAIRLANFASLDPAQQMRGIRGMPNTGAPARELWVEYQRDPEAVIAESERVLAERTRDRSIATLPIDPEIEGREREAMVKVRVNQAYFRRLVLARYESTCCVTGLNTPPLLVAAHIIPWAEAPELRVDPRNGLCINALHDRAFEVGLITVDSSYTIHINEALTNDANEPLRSFITRFDGERLRFSSEVRPNPELLERHRAKFVA